MSVNNDRELVKEIREIVTVDYPGMFGWWEDEKGTREVGNLVADEEGKLYIPYLGNTRKYNYVVSYFTQDTMKAIITHEVAKLGVLCSLEIARHDKNQIILFGNDSGSEDVSGWLALPPSRQEDFHLGVHYTYETSDVRAFHITGKTMVELCLKTVKHVRDSLLMRNQAKKKMALAASKVILEVLAGLHVEYGSVMQFVAPVDDDGIIQYECRCLDVFADGEFSVMIDLKDLQLISECMKSDLDHWNVLYVVRKVGLAPKDKFIEMLRSKIKDTSGVYTEKYSATLAECLSAKSAEQVIRETTLVNNITE